MLGGQHYRLWVLMFISGSKFVGFVISCLMFILPFAGPALAEADEELLHIVERACTKSCTEGRGDKKFCKAYCGCIRQTVQKRSAKVDIASLLKGERQQRQLIHHCSGETAVKFYEQSCRKTCKDVPNCDVYCGCLQDKITKNRKFTDIGAFFIQLGRNDNSAIGQLKRYEKLCLAP